MKIHLFCASLIVMSMISYKSLGQANLSKNGFYDIQPIDIQNIKITDHFWLPIIERVQQKTIEFALKKCKEEGRFDNFLIAGGIMKGEVRGVMPFDDTDVYKIIEGASNTLISSPNPNLEALLDSLIAMIQIGQEKDGYLTTWRTINPAKPPATWVKVIEGKRWESLEASHELYNAGHLFEAAAVHHLATGKRNFLEIALKYADLIVKTFGDSPGQIKNVPGHQIVETGLVKLYQITGQEKYLKQAKYFLDNRGNAKHHTLHGAYSQDHKPLIQQDEVVGHAVRAVYMYAGMTDIAAIYKDEAYRRAIDALWNNMTYKKTYLTGGIGAKHDGEAFGENYELPNLEAYSETCAAIGSVYWNNRLFNLTGDVKYTDVLERTLYNGVISGISLDGTTFFYPNALEADGKYTFNRGTCSRQEWFDCSCCPTNLIRFLPAVPGLIYAKEKDTLYVNLYIANQAEVDLGATQVKLTQETDYPWKGRVKITVNPSVSDKFTLKLRIPGWARDEVLPSDLYQYQKKSTEKPRVLLNGKNTSYTIKNGYFVISRTWNVGDEIHIDFPMEVKKVISHEKVAENQGKIALEYGPLVYAFEEIDNASNFDRLKTDKKTKFTARWNADLLGGVNAISTTIGADTFLAIPYYAWSNRGIGKMKVWIPQTRF